MGNRVVVERPACDWLTLTTFDEEEEARLLSLFWDMARTNGKQPVTHKQMQYSGVQFDGAFLGLGEVVKEEATRKHVMFRAWGEMAQQAIDGISEGDGARCRRIDLQITIPQPFDYRARSLKDMLNDAEWLGRRRRPILYEDEGLDTVYIGSRSSDRVIRVYVKEIDGARWLRFEVEYTGDRAGEVYKRCVSGGVLTMGGILLSEMEQLPEVACCGMVAIRERLKYCSVRVPPPSRIEQTDGKVRWLLGSVDPVIRRMVNDHDEGEVVKELVRKWYAIVQDLDKTWTLR